jgi:hypothetical protein
VELVAIDNETAHPAAPHQILLERTIAESPQLWERVGTFPRGGSQTGEIDIYRLKDATGRKAAKIHIDLPYTLKRPIDQ